MGKTSELIIRSSVSGGYIVCHSQDECSRIFAEAKVGNLSIPFPITYQEFISNKYSALGIKSFLIDNVEKLLDFISNGVPIEAITLNNDNPLSIKDVAKLYGQEVLCKMLDPNGERWFNVSKKVNAGFLREMEQGSIKDVSMALYPDSTQATWMAPTPTHLSSH